MKLPGTESAKYQYDTLPQYKDMMVSLFEPQYKDMMVSLFEQLTQDFEEVDATAEMKQMLVYPDFDLDYLPSGDC